MKRDFTYIDDVTEAVVRLIGRPAAADPAWSGAAPNPATSLAPWRVYNIGNHMPIEVTQVVRLIEEATGPHRNARTRADTARRRAGNLRRRRRSRSRGRFPPDRPIAEGVHRFVEWYRGYVGTVPV